MMAAAKGLLLLLLAPLAQSMEGLFSDPNHRKPRDGCGGSTCLSLEGLRMIKTDDDGRIYVLGADNDGLVWSLLGGMNVNDPASGQLVVDFTTKAPKVGDLSGVWTGARLDWEDGNAWTKLAASEAPRVKLDPKSDIQFDGVYVDPDIWDGGLKGLRFVTHRTGKYDGLAITCIGTDDGETFFHLAGTFRNTGAPQEATGHLHSFFIDMTPLGGEKKANGIQIRGALLWSDGTQWTKVKGTKDKGAYEAEL